KREAQRHTGDQGSCFSRFTFHASLVFGTTIALLRARDHTEEQRMEETPALLQPLPTGSYFVDRELAARAVDMAMPLLRSAMEHKEFGDSGFLHIVVMNPGMAPRDTKFEQAILYEHSLGDPANWDADYGAVARAKAKLAWCHQRDSYAVQM